MMRLNISSAVLADAYLDNSLAIFEDEIFIWRKIAAKVAYLYPILIHPSCDF